MTENQAGFDWEESPVVEYRTPPDAAAATREYWKNRYAMERVEAERSRNARPPTITPAAQPKVRTSAIGTPQRITEADIEAVRKQLRAALEPA